MDDGAIIMSTTIRLIFFYLSSIIRGRRDRRYNITSSLLVTFEVVGARGATKEKSRGGDRAAAAAAAR